MTSIKLLLMRLNIIKSLFICRVVESENHSSQSEDECDMPDIEELRKWKVNQLKSWLVKHGLKRSGSKEVLIKRVYRAYQNLVDSDFSDSSSDDSLDENRTRVQFSDLDSEKWSVASSDCLPGLLSRDVEYYYLFTKNPLSGKRAKFQRHLKKAKKLCNENYLKDIKYHAVSESSDISYIKANCKPSIKNTVQVGNAGQLSSVYTFNVCLTKLTAHIISAYCNCKAGLCAHVGS